MANAPEPFPRLEPREAIDYFRAKGLKPGFAWQDVWQEEHARAFTVAKAMRRDILETIRTALDDAIANGLTLAQFRAQVTPLLQAQGWWGKQQMIDPATGQSRLVQLGSPRRLKIIYDMNMRMAQAAGRWQRIQRSKEALPYLRYTAVMDERTRPEHAEWHGTILHVDDPWWDTHYPPCGWNCRCTVLQIDAETIAEQGWEISDGPPPSGPPRAYENPRTGEVSEVPAGFDPGFVYNVGKAWLGPISPPPLLPPELPALEPGVQLERPPVAGPESSSPLPAAIPEGAAVDADSLPALELGIQIDRPPAGEPVLLPAGISEGGAVDAFVTGAGAAPRGSVIIDKGGWPVAVAPDWFRTVDGASHVPTGDRRRVLGLVGRAIAEPREIRWRWVTGADGKPMLFRRYIAEIEHLPIVVDVGRAGWRFATARDAGFDLARLSSGSIAWPIASKVKDPTLVAAVAEMWRSSTEAEYRMGRVSAAMVSLVKRATGLDITGYDRRVATSGARHVLMEHGDPLMELSRRQFAVTPADFDLIPQIVATGTVRLLGTPGGRKPMRLEYRAMINGKIYDYRETVGGKRKVLQLQSLRIEEPGRGR